MKKLRLGLDELRVESFATEANKEVESGTVRGMAAITYGGELACVGWTAPRQATCDAAVYTCPECASPPYTDFTCERTDPNP